MFLWLDACVTVLCLSLSYVVYQSNRKINVHLSQGYVLINQVTHARLLPAKSSHSFTYSTLSYLLSLNALENSSLDLARGLVFGYGGIWGRVTGLRSAPYLADHPGSPAQTIKEKLVQLLKDRAYMRHGDVLEDAWIMTMPSFLGFEGINPLTVYYCYKPRGKFWLTVLEIHNTFGESHVHVLEVGNKEDAESPKGFHHQWTFLREFHVSPFNDRTGFYTVSIKRPTHPPTFLPIKTDNLVSSPLPTVRVHLHTLSPSTTPTPGPLKSIAVLRPTSATPLTTSSVLLALCKAPFLLFLSSPRILYQAWILHYNKRLDVYIRPEPLPATSEWVCEPHSGFTIGGNALGGGVKWQTESLLERTARTRLYKFLKARVDEVRINVILIPANPSYPRTIFSPFNRSINETSNDNKHEPSLTIHYLSPRFFTIVLLSPSAQHALLLGNTTERIFFPSSPELFMSVFSPPPRPLPHSSRRLSLCQRIRTHHITSLLLNSPLLPIPPTHALDNSTTLGSVSTIIILWTLLAFERFGAWAFRALHARVVPGQEPWKQWERAANVYQHGDDPLKVEDAEVHLGSVRREES